MLHCSEDCHCIHSPPPFLLIKSQSPYVAAPPSWPSEPVEPRWHNIEDAPTAWEPMLLIHLPPPVMSNVHTQHSHNTLNSAPVTVHYSSASIDYLKCTVYSACSIGYPRAPNTTSRGTQRSLKWAVSPPYRLCSSSCV